MATLKHFAGYGAAEGGRDYDAVYISEARMENVYLPPFRAGVEAGAATVMSAYMDLNNVPASGSVHLLHEILRKELDFKGFVVSDAFAVGSLVMQGFAKDGRDAALRGATAGVNMDMGSATNLEHMKSLIDKGQLTASQLDGGPCHTRCEVLSRVLRAPVCGCCRADPRRDAREASSGSENRSGTFCCVAAERRRCPAAREDCQANCYCWTAGQQQRRHERALESDGEGRRYRFGLRRHSGKASRVAGRILQKACR
jgi:Glycosyl hydrolase family 3 N terminal domain